MEIGSYETSQLFPFFRRLHVDPSPTLVTHVMLTLKQFHVSPKSCEIRKIKPMFDLINPQATVIRAFAYCCLSSKHKQTELKKYWKLPLSLESRRRSRRSMANQLEFWERGSVECARERRKPHRRERAEKENSEKRGAEECKQKLSHTAPALLHSSHVTLEKQTAFSHVFIAALTAAVCRRISVLCFSWSLCSLPVKRGSVSFKKK